MNIFTKTCVVIKSIEVCKLLSCNQISRSATSYKSALALENIYPGSTLKITDPKIPSIDNTFSGYIPIKELEISYSRSSGPGGQNVNKVNTKVETRFHLQSAKWLNDEAKQKIAEKYDSKLTKDGYLILRSDLTRSQQLNLADCLEKLRKMIRESLEVRAEPSIESQERARRRLERAAKERLLIKRHWSQIRRDKQDSNIVVE